MFRPIMSKEQIKIRWPNGINKEDLAKHYGLKTFDNAIPQQLFDQLAQGDFNPNPNYVYDYSKFRFGILFPLTKEALWHMERILDMTFADPRVE
jgi:hypothetical protein